MSSLLNVHSSGRATATTPRTESQHLLARRSTLFALPEFLSCFLGPVDAAHEPCLCRPFPNPRHPRLISLRAALEVARNESVHPPDGGYVQEAQPRSFSVGLRPRPGSARTPPRDHTGSSCGQCQPPSEEVH